MYKLVSKVISYIVQFKKEIKEKSNHEYIINKTDTDRDYKLVVSLGNRFSKKKCSSSS